MCQYQAHDGIPNQWHLIHLASRAIGGAGAIVAEATAVSPEGRITNRCTGIWSDAHTAAWAPITRAIKDAGAVPGIQLAHAGRKASGRPLWEGAGPLPISDGGWQTVAPSAIAFGKYPTPQAATEQEILKIQNDIVQAAVRAKDAGFEFIELHAAHGYLLHSFLSPHSNSRMDSYGGQQENRHKMMLEVVQKTRNVWPTHLPLWVRLSCTDWTPEGWQIQDSIELCKKLKPLGVDLIDCSSGGSVPNASIPSAPGYQVSFAAEIRKETGIATGAVGLITEAHQADEIIQTGKADITLVGREMLRNPYWPMLAAKALGAKPPWPQSYEGRV